MLRDKSISPIRKIFMLICILIFVLATVNLISLYGLPGSSLEKRLFEAFPTGVIGLTSLACAYLIGR